MGDRDNYWRKTRWLTAALLFAWFIVTFAIAWYGRELNAYTLFGFPLGFYMAAQGSLILFLAMVWGYGKIMDRLDDEYGVDD